jgi:hypothetical protein
MGLRRHFRNLLTGTGAARPKTVVTTFREAQRATQFVPNFATDAFLVSYPRSGNTWIRAITFALEVGRPPTNLEELDYHIPDEHYTTEVRTNQANRRLVIKTHSVFDPKYARYLYVIRNPIDSLESYYRYTLKAKAVDWPLDHFARELVCGRVWPCSWSEHVMSWTSGEKSGAVLRYEDLKVHAPGAIEALASFLDLTDPTLVHRWTTYFDFARMRELERAGNRTSLSHSGVDWFISGGRADGGREAIRNAIFKYRPEICEVAKVFGYDLSVD